MFNTEFATFYGNVTNISYFNQVFQSKFSEKRVETI